jgi:glycosyltransferase involved in cell wall biosynthesis
LCVARQDSLEKYKGFEDMFEAISILHKENPDIHLNLVGSGNDQKRLLNLTRKLGITDKVTFWGYLANNDLDAAYSDCDLYVMLSKGEVFGIVFLEAMKRGKACIGGNHGGVPEVILHNKTGYLVDYGNVNQLVKYILKLKLNQRLRADFGKRGMFRVRNVYSQKIFEQKYLALLSR